MFIVPVCVCIAVGGGVFSVPVCVCNTVRGGVLQVPDPGAGEGVPHEPLPHQAQAHRDGPPALPHREADQNMVPEQVSWFPYRTNFAQNW